MRALVAVLCAARSAGALRLPRPVRRAAATFAKTRPCGLWDDPTAPIYDGVSPLRVVSWNVQYCAGIRQHFFYDGGRAVATPRPEVEAGLAKVAETLAALDADVVLLQEVDRRSARTHRIDEFAALRAALAPRGLTCAASASYWRVPYVPHPSHEPVGRVGMHLATFSRYRLGDATRYQLPLLRESRVRRLFNLRRAVLATPLAGPVGATVLNTHLSAFSFGDGTVDRQVAALRDAILPRQSPRWLLAGDFNSLTPYEAAAALAEDEAALYPEAASPVAPLYAAYAPLWGDAAARRATYKPWTEPAPDRTIDHAFASPGATFADARIVETPGGYQSDHQPVAFAVAFS